MPRSRSVSGGSIETTFLRSRAKQNRAGQASEIMGCWWTPIYSPAPVVVSVSHGLSLLRNIRTELVRSGALAMYVYGLRTDGALATYSVGTPQVPPSLVLRPPYSPRLPPSQTQRQGPRIPTHTHNAQPLGLDVLPGTFQGPSRVVGPPPYFQKHHDYPLISAKHPPRPEPDNGNKGALEALVVMPGARQGKGHPWRALREGRRALGWGGDWRPTAAERSALWYSVLVRTEYSMGG